jgi:hypothetical protein
LLPLNKTKREGLHPISKSTFHHVDALFSASYSTTVANLYPRGLELGHRDAANAKPNHICMHTHHNELSWYYIIITQKNLRF